MISDVLKQSLIKYQAIELTEREIYLKISNRLKDEHNKKTMKKIADEESKHYEIWRKYTKKDVKPLKRKVTFYSFLAKIFGFTFAIKRMENKLTGVTSIPKPLYDELMESVPEAHDVFEDEDRHELELISMLDEERLQYVGSMVLGLNDALVEISGSLAGFAFALQSNTLIALSGLITGIAATLSMASSEFLSSRADGESDAGKSAVYTGVAYIITVALLIAPYLLLPDEAFMPALFIMLGVVVLIITVFNYYISVAKDQPFKRRFLEMTTISLGVAALSFVLGIIVKNALGVDL